jgi:hypothetical protein
MKDFIEGIQKLLPWLAGLQSAPKIIISIIIILAAAFILILIWSPTTQIKEIRNPAVPPSQRKQNLDTGETTMNKITVKEIVNYINNSAPFQRDDIAKNYLGIKVTWEGALWDINKSSFKNIRVKLNPEPDHFYGILFEVPVEKYPQFKVAQRGDLIAVSGRIIKCSGAGMYVELDADEITFHGKSVKE